MVSEPRIALELEILVLKSFHLVLPLIWPGLPPVLAGYGPEGLAHLIALAAVVVTWSVKNRGY